LHEGCVWHTSPAITPPWQVAVSPGRQVTLHEAQVPTAGALHEAPISAFFFSLFVRLSEASAGAEASRIAIRATENRLAMEVPLIQ
jgi:hypothetical protein